MRLDKFISSQGKLSRTEIKKLIKNGAVTVDGIVAADPSAQITPETANVCVSGQALCFRRHIYIMMNKPKGVISASSNPKDKTVVDLVPDELLRDGLFPAGRLDSDTTGFVLITDDGDFAHRILAPKNHVEKTYIAELRRPLTAEDIEIFEKGCELRDGYVCLPAKVRALSDSAAEIKICEGKYHQIKRMFASTGNGVTELSRIAIGGLKLDDGLGLGECREITADELELISNQ